MVGRTLFVVWTSTEASAPVGTIEAQDFVAAMNLAGAMYGDHVAVAHQGACKPRTLCMARQHDSEADIAEVCNQ